MQNGDDNKAGRDIQSTVLFIYKIKTWGTAFLLFSLLSSMISLNMQVSGLFLQSYQCSCSKHTDTAEMGEANGDRLQNRCMTFATASWKWGQCKFAQKYQPRFPDYFLTFKCYIFDGVTFVRKIFGVFSFTICNLRSACLQSANVIHRFKIYFWRLRWWVRSRIV